MVLGGIAAVANGIALPSFALIFGYMIDSFNLNYDGDKIVSAAG